jgi:hypothetical protein
MAPTAATLLRAWEDGAAVTPLDRAPSLLRSLDALPASLSISDLTVGQCDARLIELRRALFGDIVEVVSVCPACHAELEIEAPLSELQPPVLEGKLAPATVQTDGYTAVCRIPSNRDLRALELLGDRATLQDLLERCMLEAYDPDGSPVTTAELPGEVVETIVDALAEADPGAHTTLRVHCTCGSEWVDELDIRLIVWTDLTDWVGRTLTEVHQLAQAYGWSEGEILELEPWRRRWYVEATVS